MYPGQPRQNDYPGVPVGANGTALKDPSTTPIRDEISYSEQSVTDLHGELQRLEERLGTVLHPIENRTTAPPDSVRPSAEASDVRKRIVVVQCGIAPAAARVRAIIERVEI